MITWYTGWLNATSYPGLQLMKLRQVVAKNLRKLRGERGLSQEELADRAGLNRNYVGMIEREENAPTVDTLEDLARALDVSVIDLVRNGPR
jgi:transcriptional regulator with XRE-family HTH domain